MKAVVIGLGYVGLPLAIRLTQIGLEVIGIDKDKRKIELLKTNRLPFAQNEPNLSKFFIKSQKTNSIQFTTSYQDLKHVNMVFVCVDTPIKKGKPNNSSLLAAIESIAKHLIKNQIIIIESTLAPKTTEDLVVAMLEKNSKMELNKDFFIAVAPERIRPNYIFKQLTTNPRVLGVSSEKIAPVLKKIYSKITSGQLDFVNIRTAEVVKAVENTYRDVQIAFANEIALACEELGVNVWEVRELVNKSPLRDVHRPGAGVGGHCIPKDPWLLASSVHKANLTLTKNARAINDSMPKHILNLLKSALLEKGLRKEKARVVILGYSYAPDSDDTRNSPTQSLAELLKRENIKFRIHDPYVKEYRKINIDQAISKSDSLVIMVAHSIYKKLSLSKIAKLMRTKIIIDGRNLIYKEKAQSAGFLYKGIGNV